MRLREVAALLLSVAPSAVRAETASLPAVLAVRPFTDNAGADANLAFLQKDVIYWVRRWGQPTDDPQQVEARLGPDAFRLLGAGTASAYAAVLSGQVTATDGRWSVDLVVTGVRDGVVWKTERATGASLTELLDTLSNAAHDIATVVGQRTGQPVVQYVPPTRPYATWAFVGSGLVLATGATFFILGGVEDAKLPNPALSLPEAVSARNAAKTYQTVGYTMTAIGLVGMVVGIFLYAPGAIPPPAVSISVDPARGMVLVGGPLP